MKSVSCCYFKPNRIKVVFLSVIFFIRELLATVVSLVRMVLLVLRWVLNKIFPSPN